MNIEEFISEYKNYPVLFIGSGFTLRYLNNAYNWDQLLLKACVDLFGDNKFYYDLKYEFQTEYGYDYPKIASEIEKAFDIELKKREIEKFKEINEIFYEMVKNGNPVSRFKLYLADLLRELEINDTKKLEIEKLKQAKKNISSIITTNYDLLLEEIFSFKPLIGNDILLSNPFGSIYKIHGCVTKPEDIIITEKDYRIFEKSYELIKAQLISLFIHNPIIFIGYSIEDTNIRKLLKTIFSYVKVNSDIGRSVIQNFLLVEYVEGSNNTEITDHSLQIDDQIIKINKISTDNFYEIYEQLKKLHLPVSVMDIRKVENIVKKIKAGGEIKVHIVEDIDQLSNSETVLAIGSEASFKYVNFNPKDFIKRYFEIIKNRECDIVKLINGITIKSNQYFPIFGFNSVCKNIENFEELCTQQKELLNQKNTGWKTQFDKTYLSPLSPNVQLTIDAIESDNKIQDSYKKPVILYAAYNNFLNLDDLKSYLKQALSDKLNTFHRQLVCIYDLKKYGEV